MRIVNPLYDTAFKYLMQNEKYARKVLSVILDVEIEEVHLTQQETVYPDEKRHLTLFRLDFKALIVEPDGTKKTILIELQKSKYKTDIQRFRHYLGSAYMDKPRKDIVAEPPEQYGDIFPIVTIYILGYKLDELPYMAVTVNREVIDAATKQKIEVESFFIEHLTHKSHIIQVRRLPEQRRTKLEKFMLLFNQAWVAETKSILDLEELPEGFEDLANHLHGPVADAKFLRDLEAEEELDSIFDDQEARYLMAVLEKEEAEKREAEERRQKEEAKQKIIGLAKFLKQLGLSIREIAQKTGLGEHEIEFL